MERIESSRSNNKPDSPYKNEPRSKLPTDEVALAYSHTQATRRKYGAGSLEYVDAVNRLNELRQARLQQILSSPIQL